jgi:succinate dehydrogenase / fumarate reductase iron-sulfur subunit
MIEKWGTLHEAQMLPRSFGDGSMIKGQTEPGAVKQLVEALPTALRGLKSGKVTVKKALLHPKLPDQDQVRRIYKEIHSKDERLELNMYIVGENSEEEQPSPADVGQET